MSFQGACAKKEISLLKLVISGAKARNSFYEFNDKSYKDSKS